MLLLPLLPPPPPPLGPAESPPQPGRLSQQPRSGGEGLQRAPREGGDPARARARRPRRSEAPGMGAGGERRGGSRGPSIRGEPTRCPSGPARHGGGGAAGGGARSPAALIAAPPPPGEGLPLPHHNKARAPPPRAAQAWGLRRPLAPPPSRRPLGPAPSPLPLGPPRPAAPETNLLAPELRLCHPRSFSLAAPHRSAPAIGCPDPAPPRPLFAPPATRSAREAIGFRGRPSGGAAARNGGRGKGGVGLGAAPPGPGSTPLLSLAASANTDWRRERRPIALTRGALAPGREGGNGGGPKVAPDWPRRASSQPSRLWDPPLSPPSSSRFRDQSRWGGLRKNWVEPQEGAWQIPPL
ncbi:basic salivary proline-rich protein 1-like [Candoia aspera]|uniref:basic salivary proline-rich protein 1-like n=1 Tax=Candoia aspera TaxID=51853 RepID=UPI002FD84B66